MNVRVVSIFHPALGKNKRTSKNVLREGCDATSEQNKQTTVVSGFSGEAIMINLHDGVIRWRCALIRFELVFLCVNVLGVAVVERVRTDWESRPELLEQSVD